MKNTPAHISRKRDPSQSRKGPERVAIEAALKSAGASGLTREEIVTRCQLDLRHVVSTLSNLVQHGQAHRLALQPGQLCSRWAWGGRPATARPVTARTRRGPSSAASTPAQPCIPAPQPAPTIHAEAASAVVVEAAPAAPAPIRTLPAYSARPGAMDAFRLPSMENGVRIERRAPIIMSSSVGHPRRPE